MSHGQGLGRESALRLAKAGATVVLTTRSAVKGQKAVEEVKLGEARGEGYIWPWHPVGIDIGIDIGISPQKSLGQPWKIEVQAWKIGLEPVRLAKVVVFNHEKHWFKQPNSGFNLGLPIEKWDLTSYMY